MATKQNNPNMRLYEAFRSPDPKAVKKFHNGKFGGDDTNPMWRIKALTEVFGPCGEGWKISNTKYWAEERQAVKNGHTVTEKMAFCTLDLYWKKDNGEWSEPVSGIGGNSFTQQGDEAYKGAETDAISIACKKLGMCADIWFSEDRTSKYFQYYDENKQDQQPNNTPVPAEPATHQLVSFITANDAQRKWAVNQIKKGKGFVGKKEMTALLESKGFSLDDSTWAELYAESYKTDNAS